MSGPIVIVGKREIRSSGTEGTRGKEKESTMKQRYFLVDYLTTLSVAIWQDDRRMINWKEFERKASWFNVSCYLGINQSD